VEYQRNDGYYYRCASFYGNLYGNSYQRKQLFGNDKSGSNGESFANGKHHRHGDNL
jgi:hypothetical protein